MRPEPVLAISGLVVHHGGVRALESIDITANSGEIVVLLGANGAGKSTLIETIIGLNVPRSGSIRFHGEEISGMAPDTIVRRGVAVVPEGRGVFSSMTVRDNLLLGAVPGDERSHRLASILRRFPVLSERSSQLAGTLSGGEARILVVARALMSNPGLILLDEPSIGLAPQILRSLFDLVVSLAEEGFTILMAEQNAYQALRIAHRGYVLERGRVVHRGSAADLRDDPRIAEAYLGASR